MTIANSLSGLIGPLRRHPWWFLVLLLALIAAGVFYTRAGGSGSGSPEAAKAGGRGAGGPLPITVSEVTLKDMPVWLPGIGTAVPRNLATVRVRVDGLLLGIHFTEGQMVKAGQLLAEIDPAPFEAQLAQANGQLARDTAQLNNARLDLERYRDLWAKDSIAKQQLDTQEALVRQYEGTVENGRGAVATAKLQLDYTRVIAPVSGRIGLRQVDPGNQVHASDANGIASIAQIQPMTVIFAVPETQVPRINRRLAGGELLVVEAWDREQKNLLAKGRLLTTDNQIDPATGTIKLKAEFANADSQLFPNQFVNARLLLGTQQEAIVVPAAAVLRGSQGSFVYTVDAENTVKSVPVKSGIADGSLMSVEGALKAGDRVVLDGSDNLRDGAKVEVITVEQRQQAQAPAAGKGKGTSRANPK
ncbi:MAG: MdtA/MuxA family multidrug efflux RND transporter periplasmic adaptor subunit [Zoogloeaceae bacterium]|jgi:multidrug efflux system membrane fusion protein|nr:MdtA/MuxA family multidrug efflux RND transporter periplasmic adaptor subunit [Zoogloeaceae bacterium]